MTHFAPTTPTPLSAEAALLCEALDLEPTEIREFSREPLGDGTVAGFTVKDDDRELAVYVDTSGIAVEAETGLAQEGVGRIWTHPADPHLPALAAAAFGSAVQTLLSRLDIVGVAEPEMVAYRPGRRAVLRVATASGTQWIKIVRPRHVEQIVEAHRVLREAGVAVPQVRAWSPTGLLVIDQAIGTPATNAAWTPSGIIDAVERVREAIAATPATRRTRSAALSRVDWYADRLIALDPALMSRVDAVRAALVSTPASSEATVHGDLHFGQLFMNERADDITGLIDVDTLGVGDRAEDPAAFLSHAVASWAFAMQGHAAAAHIDESADDASHNAVALAAASSAVRRLEDLVIEATTRWGGDAAVCGRTSAQLLGHTASALESGHRERAERLLAQAESWARGVAATQT